MATRDEIVKRCRFMIHTLGYRVSEIREYFEPYNARKMSELKPQNYGNLLHDLKTLTKRKIKPMALYKIPTQIYSDGERLASDQIVFLSPKLLENVNTVLVRDVRLPRRPTIPGTEGEIDHAAMKAVEEKNPSIVWENTPAFLVLLFIGQDSYQPRAEFMFPTQVAVDEFLKLFEL